MKWEAKGTDRSTGGAKTVVVEAETEDSARRRANRRGLVVASLHQVANDDSVNGMTLGASSSTDIGIQAPGGIDRLAPSLVLNGQTAHVPPASPAPAGRSGVAGSGGAGDSQREWSRLIAGALSLLVPGLGQMYKGQLIGGLFWLCGVVLGYAAFVIARVVMDGSSLLVIPGLVLHALCVLGAVAGNPDR